MLVYGSDFDFIVRLSSAIQLLYRLTICIEQKSKPN